MGLIDEKKIRGRKSRASVPLKSKKFFMKVAGRRGGGGSVHVIWGGNIKKGKRTVGR